MELVTVAFFENPTKAHLAKNRLDGEGIESSLVGRGITHVRSGSTKIELLVREEDAERAISLVGKESEVGSSLSGEYLVRFSQWIVVLPAVAIVFLASRFALSWAFPGIATPTNWQFVFAGPVAGMLAAFFAAPKWKMATALIAFGFCLQVARNL